MTNLGNDWDLLLKEETEQPYIILHEQTHIRRLDHVVKAIAFLAKM